VVAAGPVRLRQLGMLLCLLGSPGCAGGLAGWQRPPEPLPDSLPPRQQVQIWSRDRSFIWHGVWREGATLTGVLYHRPLTCGRCRQTMPLEAVDSLRLGSLERAGWLVASSPWLLAGAFLIYMRATWGSD
jgi:hypothetical protein